MASRITIRPASRRHIGLMFLTLGVSAGLLAQNTAGVGSISGTVQDATGASIPNAKVVVENPDRGIRRDLTTNGAGLFVAPALLPSSGYTVTITAEGFNPYTVKDITVNVGETVTLNPVLSVSGAATRVEVTAQAPVVENEKTDVSQVVNTRQIVDLPINGRRVDSFVLLTPGVTNDQAFGLLTFRGNPGGNTFLTDGIDTTNQFYDENAGRTRTYNISQDAVQEFQVVSSNYLAEYGNASGGVVNTITRSGSNDIHGTAYWFFRNRTLEATDPSSGGLNPPEWRHQAGVSVGGPIKKDKLFYFFNGELQRRNDPIASTNISNLSMFNAQGQYVGGPYSSTASSSANQCTAPATAQQCAAAIQYIQGRVAPQLVPRTSDVNLLFGKIDYQMSDRNRLTLEANYLDFRAPNGIQTQASLTNGAAVGNNADTNVFDRTAKAGLTSVISPRMVNEARFGMFKDRQYDPASPSLLPSIGPVGLSVGTPALSNLGYATSYPRLLPSELRFQGADTLSYTVGRHNVKFGVDYQHVEDYVSQLSNQFGTYTYSTLTAFAQDFGGGAKDFTRYTQTFGNPVIDLNFNLISLFLQDEFHVTPKLTITPGARYEYETIPQPTQVNPAFPQTGHIPDKTLNLAPRFGIAYAFNDKTVVRGGYGIFFNRYIASTIESLFLNNGLYQASYTLNGNVASQLAAGPFFPNHLTTPPNVPGSANINFADPNYRNAYSQQADFGIERQIGPGTSLTVSYVWSRSLHITSGFDANAASPTASYTYPILDPNGNVVGNYTTPLYTQRINPAYGKIMELSSNANSYYNGLIVQVQKRFNGWFQGTAAYTWSHAIDYDIGGAAGGPGGQNGILYVPTFPTSVFNNDFRDEKGSASNDQRHRLVVNGIVTPRFVHGDSAVDRYLINNWQLAAISTFASSFPLPPTIAVNSAPTGVLSTSTINGLGGSTRVPFESISALNVGQIYRTDARITKILRFSERFQAQLMFEAFNVFNHLIPTGRQAEQYFTCTGTACPGSAGTTLPKGQIALAPYPFYGQITQTQTPPDGTTARRAQAALRLVF